MPESWKQVFCSSAVCCEGSGLGVCIDGYLDVTKIGAWKEDTQRSEGGKRLWAKILSGIVSCDVTTEQCLDIS